MTKAIAASTPPTITAHPQSTTACGSKTPISVTANAGSGATLSYQWWKQGTGAIVGATGASYSVTASGDYWAVVTDDNTCSVTSNHATVTLNNPEEGGRIGDSPGQVCTDGNDGGRIGNND
jgi:hypothetical protein